MKEKEEGAKPQKSGFLVRLTALAATAALLLGALTHFAAQRCMALPPPAFSLDFSFTSLLFSTV